MGKQQTLSIVLLAISAVLLGSSAGCRKARRAVFGSGDPGAAPPPARIAEPRPELPAPPNVLPMVGAESFDADGFPLHAPDVPALLSALFAERFDALDGFIGELQALAESDPKKEFWVVGAADGVASPDPEVGRLLDLYVARMPSSFVPYLLRGLHRVELGYHFRGAKLAAQTSDAQLDAMGRAFATARADLDEALSIRPKLSPAFRGLLSMAVADGSGAVEIKDLAHEVIPNSLPFEMKLFAMGFHPKWGSQAGSIDDELERIKEKMTSRRWAALRGMKAYFACDLNYMQGALQEALVKCNEAIAAGPSFVYLEQRAAVYTRLDDVPRALLDLDSAIEMFPYSASMFERRARLLWKGKKHLEAAEDILTARRLDPVDERTAQDAAKIAGILVALSRSSKLTDAARGLELIRGLGYRSESVDRGVSGRRVAEEGGVGALLAEVSAAPDDIDARVRLDDALFAEGRLEEIVEMWTEYLGRHPDDARALRERGGTYGHLKRFSLARDDFRRSCQLGEAQACGTFQRLAGAKDPEPKPEGSPSDPGPAPKPADSAERE